MLTVANNVGETTCSYTLFIPHRCQLKRKNCSVLFVLYHITIECCCAVATRCYDDARSSAICLFKSREWIHSTEQHLNGTKRSSLAQLVEHNLEVNSLTPLERVSSVFWSHIIWWRLDLCASLSKRLHVCLTKVHAVRALPNTHNVFQQFCLNLLYPAIVDIKIPINIYHLRNLGLYSKRLFHSYLYVSRPKYFTPFPWIVQQETV
jgi:hypothetical protein